MYFILLSPKQLKAMATTKSSQEPWVTFACLAVAVAEPLEAAVKPLLSPDQLLNKQHRVREQLKSGLQIRNAVADSGLENKRHRLNRTTAVSREERRHF